VTQPSLFDEPESAHVPDAALIRAGAKARKADPATSHRAAAQVESSGTAAAHREKIVAALRAVDGQTSDEIANLAGLDRVAAARRMKELETAGRVRRGPERKSNVSGNAGVTWWVARGASS
jgi:hypothetical protein